MKDKDIEKQIKGYRGLRNLAINLNQKETVDKFIKLIEDLEDKLANNNEK